MNAIQQPQPQHFGSPSSSPSLPMVRRHPSKHQFIAELSQCLFDFVIQLLPTQEEMAVKEDVRKLLERLIRTIEPDSRLLSFGSTANGFALRNSDMDLCCLIDSGERLSAADLVMMVGDLLERETKFHVKTLPHARIPIVKLTLDPSPGLPLAPMGLACDIGFENRLALENTRLLMSYAMIDPPRVRTLVLFLKVWCKRRKINSPYRGTLSSYGYVLLVLYFLIHVKNPPVLPNLQQIPPMYPIPDNEIHLNGRNIWFFDDIEVLRQSWVSDNTESVAELLIDFFRYYSRDFSYNTGAASIRSGLLKKESKGWLSDNDPRFGAGERNRLCIEDPFETDYNVGRCVTKDGLYTIRGEFMRASRILANRPERAVIALAQLCEERNDDLLRSPGTSTQPTTNALPRLSSIPPQMPYTVGATPRPTADRLSPPHRFFDSDSSSEGVQQVPSRSPPSHMAPQRSKFTSPPPPEAPANEHDSFKTRLDEGISLAMSSSQEARDRNPGRDLQSDEDAEHFMGSPDMGMDNGNLSDDDRSVHSLIEGQSHYYPSLRYRNHFLHGPILHPHIAPLSRDDTATPRFAGLRGRLPMRPFEAAAVPAQEHTVFGRPHREVKGTPPPPPSSFQQNLHSRRSFSGTGRSLSTNASPIHTSPIIAFPSGPALPIPIPAPPSPTPSDHSYLSVSQSSTASHAPQTTVYYETVQPQDYQPHLGRVIAYVTPSAPSSRPSSSSPTNHNERQQGQEHLTVPIPSSSPNSSPSSSRPSSRTSLHRDQGLKSSPLNSGPRSIPSAFCGVSMASSTNQPLSLKSMLMSNTSHSPSTPAPNTTQHTVPPKQVSPSSSPVISHSISSRPPTPSTKDDTVAPSEEEVATLSHIPTTAPSNSSLASSPAPSSSRSSQSEYSQSPSTASLSSPTPIPTFASLDVSSFDADGEASLKTPMASSVNKSPTPDPTIFKDNVEDQLIRDLAANSVTAG